MKVKIETKKGVVYVEKPQTAKVIVSKEKQEVFICLNYGGEKDTIIGHFENVETAEKIILNEL